MSEYFDAKKFISSPTIRCLSPNMVAFPPQEVIAKIRVIRKIKDGGNSRIYEAYDQELPGLPLQPNCAIKERSKREADGLLGLAKREQQWKETDIHFEVNECPNIATLFKVIDCEASSLMVVEYFPERDLMKAIKERQNWGVDGWVKGTFLQIVKAMEFCHEKGIFHRDLKCENILVSGDRVALTDFGSAAREQYSDIGRGSIGTMSPECLTAWSSPGKHPPYALAPSDIWSLGIILVNMTTKRVPWSIASTSDEDYSWYRSGVPLNNDVLMPLHDEAQVILNGIFEEDPRKRPTISELYSLIDGCMRFGSHEGYKLAEGLWLKIEEVE